MRYAKWAVGSGEWAVGSTGPQTRDHGISGNLGSGRAAYFARAVAWILVLAPYQCSVPACTRFEVRGTFCVAEHGGQSLQ